MRRRFSPLDAPGIEPGMKRELEAVLDYRCYVLREDKAWHGRPQAFCEMNKKYNVHASLRYLLEKEDKLAVAEVERLPIVFQVREQSRPCAFYAYTQFGIFHWDVAESPAWPARDPLLHWTETRDCCSCDRPVELLTSNGDVLGYSHKPLCADQLSVFNEQGDLMYWLRKPDAKTEHQLGVYEGETNTRVGFIQKIGPLLDSVWCDCSSENMASARFPVESSLEGRLLLLRELVMKGHRS